MGTTDKLLSVNTKVFGARREVYVNGRTYAIFPVDPPADYPPGASWDRWHYTLPTGETFSHPEKFGALLMILKDIGGGEWSAEG